MLVAEVAVPAAQLQLRRRRLRHCYRCSKKKRGVVQCSRPRSVSRTCHGVLLRRDPGRDRRLRKHGGARRLRRGLPRPPRRRHGGRRQADSQRQARGRGGLPERDLHRGERAPPQPGAPPRLLPPARRQRQRRRPVPGLPVLRERIAGLVTLQRGGEEAPAALADEAPHRRRRGPGAGVPDHECHRQILHLDIKPANILLDGGLRAHVSDFGISMSIAWDATSVDTCGRGTPGYMAPEIWASALSAKADVYSYGVTLLDLVGGRRSLQLGAAPSQTPDSFPRAVWERMARGEVMDEAMARVDVGEVETVVKVALCCLQHRREMRPSMLMVVDMLEGRVAADMPPEARPS